MNLLRHTSCTEADVNMQFRVSFDVAGGIRDLRYSIDDVQAGRGGVDLFE